MEESISRQTIIDGLEFVIKHGIETDGAHSISAEKMLEFVRELPTVQPEIVRCKNCKHFEYDHVANINGIPLIVAHEICTRWGDGVKTSENGYCFLAERIEKTT